MPEDCSHWTIQALKEYVDSRLLDDEKSTDRRFLATNVSVDRAFSAQQVALDKAEQALTLRLEAMNEFRAQLQSERGTYITREFADAQLAIRQEQQDGNQLRFEKIERAQARLSGQLMLVAFAAPLVTGIVVGLITYALTRHP